MSIRVGQKPRERRLLLKLGDKAAPALSVGKGLRKSGSRKQNADFVIPDEYEQIVRASARRKSARSGAATTWIGQLPDESV